MKPTTVEATQEMSTAGERQVVVLQLGDEVYGVDIAAIYTVLMPQEITAVPQTPPYIKGVMNLRGQILPVLDLRVRFDLPATEGAKTRIVIVNVDGTSAGMVVDAVSEVLRLPESRIEPPSALLSSVAAECITGIGRTVAQDGEGERLVLLLDVEKVLNASLSDADVLQRLQAAA
jgi:purine-binding chemotaxis protein CheW